MVLFRADGNKTLGTGHVMRCLSIADAFRERGIESVFVCADHNMENLITGRGYNIHVLESEYDDLSEETEKFIDCELYNRATAIIVDSYFVNREYVEAISHEKKTVYIDDYFSNYPFTCIVNYSVYAEKRKYEEKFADKIPKLILGPDFAPLRKDFYDCETVEIKEKATEILVLTGGSDPFQVGPELAKEIDSRGVNDLRFHFVCGALSDAADELIKYQNDSIIVHFDVKDMKTLMCSSDMAISAAGSTMYELCACGVPTINYSIADNQRLGADGFADRGIMRTMGVVNNTKIFCEGVLDAVDELSMDYEKRSEMSLKAKALVDGNGAKRLVSKLEELILE